MSKSFAPAASAPIVGQPFRILVARPHARARPTPFVHPDVTWISCRLDSECLRRAAGERPDLVLIQTIDSIATALQLCRSLRGEDETKSTRIAIWSPGLEQARRLEFYEAGADDVVTDTVIGSESVMRLTADARRSSPGRSQLAVAGLTLFPDRHLAWRLGKSIALSQFQVQLLTFLMAHPETVFTRDDLWLGVWGGRPIDRCSISTAVNRLKHLLSLPGAPDIIHTVRGRGYVLQTP